LRVAAKFQNVCFPLSSKSRVGCTHTPWSKRNLKRKNMLWNVKHKVTCFVPISIDILVLLFLPPRKSWKEQPTACPYFYIYIFQTNPKHEKENNNSYILIWKGSSEVNKDSIFLLALFGPSW
jgi:hypothetical protein